MNRSRILGAAAGAALLVLLIWSIGLVKIAAIAQRSGYVVVAVLLASGLRLVLQTWAWATALRAEGREESLGQLIGIRLASQATTYLVALGPVVSEPAKIALLRGTGRNDGVTTATLIETGTYWFLTVLLGLFGTIAAGALVIEASFMFAPLAVFGAAAWFFLSKRALLVHLVALLGRHAPGWLCAAAKVEERTRSFRLRHPRAAGQVLALDAVAQVLTLFEVAAALWTVGIQPSVSCALVIEAAGRMVKTAAVWVPGRIGADEGGAAGTFALLGFPPTAGLMLVLARRVRDGLWCLLGVMWLMRFHTRRAQIKVQRKAEVEAA